MFIRQIEAFRATMLSGTVSGAAVLLGVSQPAVSRLIGRMEKELNLTLFDRSKGRLAPTVEAQILHEQIERTFISVDKIREAAADIGGAQAGYLHIAALPAVGLHFLPDVIREFHDGHPKVKVTAEINTSPRVEEGVAAQRVDLGLAEFPFRRTGIESEVFCDVPECLVVPPGHKLAGAAVARPTDLEGAPFISLMRENVGRHVIDRIFDRAGVTRRLVAETQFNGLMCELVQRGVGVSIVDPFTAAYYATRGVVAVPFRPVIKIRIGLLYPTHRPLSRVARAFLTVLRRRRNELLRGGWRA
jgi:DNA-binding transcriptional LysR family regulator